MDIRYELLQCCIEEMFEKMLSDTRCDFVEKINTKAIMALNEIKGIVSNEELSDFDAIENIVYALEKYNIGCDGRHDF